MTEPDIDVEKWRRKLEAQAIGVRRDMAAGRRAVERDDERDWYERLVDATMEGD